MSVGQLLRMTPEQRAKVIADLSPEVRLSLALLATHGLGNALGKADEYRAILHALTIENGGEK